MILKKKIQLNFINVSKFYNKIFVNNTNILKKKKQFPLFSIFMHKKLTYFRYFYKGKFFIYSNGQLLKNKIKKIKFFKKSLKNFGYIINLLNRKFSNPIKFIYLFYCKNFNFKNYLWIKKFYFLLDPQIEYFIISGSWNYIKKKRGRIKRKVLKKLIANSKAV